MFDCVTTGTGANGVCLLGEAWGKVEAQRQLPFQGPAGAKLAKLLGMLGYDRDEFLIANVCSFQPPGNRDPTEAEIQAWWPETQRTIVDSGIKVVIPLGNVPLNACLRLDGVLGKRGYVYWSDCLKMWTVPTVHPAFLLRGNANWTAVWLRDVQQALEIAVLGPPAAPRRTLTLDPSPKVARDWIVAYKEAGTPLAFDIEMPGRDKDDDEVEIGLGHQTVPIYRIGFAYRTAGGTQALSIPWGAGYLSLVRELLTISAPVTVVWNRHFDVPRLRAHGLVIAGQLHDAQEMWHVLYPDLRKKLEFVAPILVPAQPYWKDQAYERPAFYNATDAAVTIEAFEKLYC